MKKTILFLAAIAAFMGCAKEVLDENTKQGVTIFSGEILQTKISMGEKEDNVYNVVWDEVDTLGIMTMNEGEYKYFGKATLTDGAGTSNGVFEALGTIPAGTDVKLFINSNIDGKSNIPSTQKRNAGAMSLNDSAVAYAEATITEGATPFKMQYDNAIVKMVVSSSAYSDFYLKSVMLYSKGAQLSGEGGAEDYVETIIDNPSKLSATQEIWMSALPTSSTADFYAVVTLVDKLELAGKTVTIPVLFEGKQVVAGKVNTIKLENLTKESNSCKDWYECEETRDLLDAYAYGEENTFFVISKQSGHTTLSFNLKARGRFNKVSKPQYYGFVTPTDKTSKYPFLKLMDGTSSQDAWDDVRDNFVPDESHTLGSDCSISVQSLDMNTAGTTFGVMAIYNADKDLIWSFMFWRYRENDPPCDIEYKNIGVKLLDRAIGQSNGTANLTDPNINSGDLNCYGALFQWGRKDPIPYSYDGRPHYEKAKVYRPGTTTRDDAYSTIDLAINHPFRAYLLSKSQNWMTDMPAGLWGVSTATSSWYDENAVGHKTIYDPCPAGYRVCDSKVLNEIDKNGEFWERTDVVKKYHSAAVESRNHATYFGGSALAYPLENGKVDYWLYSGYSAGNTFDTGRTPTSSDSGGAYWSNNFVSNGKAAMYQFVYSGSKWYQGGTSVGSSYLQTVRCQKI